MGLVIKCRAGVRPTFAHGFAKDHALFEKKDVHIFLARPLRHIGDEHPPLQEQFALSGDVTLEKPIQNSHILNELISANCDGEQKTTYWVFGDFRFHLRVCAQRSSYRCKIIFA